jgi:hypothetical protein
MAVSETRTVNVEEGRVRIQRCFNLKRPVFLWGPPGVGKSDIISQITDDLNGYMIDLRLGQMDPTDIRGIPFFNKEAGKMDWAPPIELPDAELAAEYPVIVLFLDEMNSATPAVQAAAYQLILNRRVGKYSLPENVVIVAAGNRDSDKGVTYRMPTPLANRFVHLEVKADFQTWQTWAVKHKVHQDVVGYLSFAKQDLFDFDPRSSSRSFATPRSWVFVSDFCQDADITESELSDLVCGSVGEGVSGKFMAHRKIAGSLPKPEDILSGKTTKMDSKEISAMYALTTSMCYELQDFLEKNPGKDMLKEFHKQADNFLKFMMENFTTEVCVMGARVALTTYNLPMVPGKMPSFDEFHKKYGKYVIAAASSNK